MDDLLAEFIAETLETLEALSGEVVAWEADPTDSERLNAFFRFFHTVKGSCGFLNLPRFERLSHSAEDVLAAIRSGERSADPLTISAVLAVMDRIGALARAVADGSAVAEADDDALLDALQTDDGGIELFDPLPVAAAQPAQATAQGVREMPAVVLPAEGEHEPARAQQTVRAASGRDKGPRTIRLPLSLIDQIMNGVSDMVLARNELSRKMRERHVDPDLESSFDRLSANVADLRDMISKTRMQRVDRLYAAVPRMVRDLSRDLGKKVAVEMDGGDVEMDREMIEMVVDPLTHIVRNALDHGIETPADRVAAGKAETGTLRLVARQSGNQIVIEVSDDGRGINCAALVEKAVSRNLVTARDAAQMDDQAKLQLIFHAGLSTASAVTAVSGRGVGMDVVRANVEQIGGVIGIESTPGRGTAITMRVPLTLTIIPGLIVQCAGQYFAMPQGNVVELLHEDSSTVRISTVGGGRVVEIRGVRHSFIDLEDVMGMEKQVNERLPRTLLVVRSSAGLPYALGVEAVESNEELVIRPASPLVAMAGLYAGMTLPDTGQPMLLLDAAGIAQVAQLPLREEDAAAQRSRIGAEREDGGESIAALHYVELSGEHRLMPLNVVDRVEDIAAAAIGHAGGRCFVTLDGQMMPALNGEGVAGAQVKSLRLSDGERQYCYLIREVVDIVEAPPPGAQADGDGKVAGVVMLGGAFYELIDPFRLFAALAAMDEGEGVAAAAPSATGKHCLILDGEDEWMRVILAPLLRQAGHRVSFEAQAGSTVDVMLMSARDSADPADLSLRVPVLRLREKSAADPGTPASLYRYDREGLLAALQSIGKEQAA